MIKDMNNIHSVFIGRSTIDIEYVVDGLPPIDAKSVAKEFILQPGGPALNAAVTFSHLGGNSTLCTMIGENGFGDFIMKDLKKYRVNLLDASSGNSFMPPVSSIFIDEVTGSRTIVNSPFKENAIQSTRRMRDEAASSHATLVDGFYPNIAVECLRAARETGRETIMDGGSWKQQFTNIIPLITTAICSERFLPPSTNNSSEVINVLSTAGVARVAVTRGQKPILYYENGCFGEIDVPVVKARDTLGAGDIFHGAFCFYFLQSRSFVLSLRQAAKVAALSCTVLGTRSWMTEVLR